MIALPSLLVGPATEAGIKVPPDIDNYVPEEFPHFHAFSNAQIGQPMPSPTSHWENAKIIASITEDKIFNITYSELYKMGFQVGSSRP